jgi:DNA polymerase (family 10)
MNRKEMTERILTAMNNPYVTCLTHPTGRVVNRRDAYNVDLAKIFEFAKTKNVLLEINSSERLDLSDYNVKKAKEAGCRFFINTDTHALKQLDRMKYGVFQARRGWVTKEDVVNTWPLKELEKFLKNK